MFSVCPLPEFFSSGIVLTSSCVGIDLLFHPGVKILEIVYRVDVTVVGSF